MNHEQLAEQLHSIGWRSPMDAQWDHLKGWLETFPFEEEDKRLKDAISLARHELSIMKQTVISIIGGVDYEGFPITELNYLQRLRILVDKEKKSESTIKEIAAISTDRAENFSSGDDYFLSELTRAVELASSYLKGKVCSGCKQPIDPETCWCGSPIKGHSMTDNHGPIEMGCICHTQDFQPEEDDSVPM